MRNWSGLPMPLGNMRALGVRSITAHCACGHAGQADVSALADEVAVPSTRFRLRCSVCGSRPIDVRPNWLEHRAIGAGVAM